MNKKYYKRLDILRFVSCIAVLFYHLGILKGGYLAVCTFFVLSGYLGVVSSYNKKDFSILKYYKSRIIKVYFPLLIVVFLSIVLLNAFSSFNWINLKPEVTSVIAGYNNYWQINANLDYFVRNTSSPFMHFWYIAILLQFELVFPWIYIILKKTSEKISKFIPCFLLFALGIASAVLFYLDIKNGRIMNAYYGTLARVFSLLFGMLIGFVHSYYKPLTFKNEKLNDILFFIYLIALILMCIFIDSNTFMKYSMFVATFISMRLISYGISNTSKRNYMDYTFSSLAHASYEIYLFQYPIIFIFNDIKMNEIIKIILIIIICFAISGTLHYCMSIKKKDKTNIIKIPVLVLTLLLCFNGVYKYVVAKDYTEDMKKLEADLDENQKLIEQKQKEYLEKQKEEEQKWQEFLDNSNKEEENVESYVRNLKIVGIGDSVMELAVKQLYKEFPNGYFDAATNRIEKNAPKIISELNSKGIVGDAYLLNIGINGYCNVACKEEIIKPLGDKKIFWVNATKPDYEQFNKDVDALASKHDNVYVIDWRSYGLAHPEYLIYDGVHPNVKGCGIYANELYKGIYNIYLDEFKKEKEAKIKEHEEHEKNKITFIGNDLLSEIYTEINENYKDDNIILDVELTKEKLKEKIKDKDITNRVVLILNDKIRLNDKDYDEIIELTKGKKLYIVNTNNLKKKDNVILIDFNIKENVIFDKVHLSEKGKTKLYESIKSSLDK
jgi:peptidoglycan/LPS O-acetylase OafA/YrhL/lysophospholipase L1-like esterase